MIVPSGHESHDAPEPRRAHRRFRFGIQYRGARSVSEWVARAHEAEELGYSVVTMPDHIAEHLAPVPALTAVALSTSALRVGTMVMSNDWRNPVLLAREVATLDWISSGRFEFGVGAGWQPRDYNQLGISYESPLVRIRRLREAVEIMAGLLAGERVTYSGDFYNVVDATCYPRPVQIPRPPIAIGGGSRHILSLAGQIADIVSIHTNVGAGQGNEQTRPDLSAVAAERRVDWVRIAAGGRFHDIELGLRVPMVATGDRTLDAVATFASRWHISAEEVLASPYALVGEPRGIADALIERRERFGFSYFVWDEPELKRMARVIALLAGQ